MIASIGRYCGRAGPGWWGEPQNSLTNLGFVIAAVLAVRAWRRRDDRDPAVLVLAAGAVAIAIGSFVFHSHPTPTTLQGDLIPIQIFGLLFAAFAMRRLVGARWPATLAVTIAFGVASELWQRVARGVLGGGGHHLLPLTAIAILGGWLVATGRNPRAGRWLLAAACAYAIAIVFRALDLPVCDAFPLGTHWAWHLTQGVTVGCLLQAAVAAGSRSREP